MMDLTTIEQISSIATAIGTLLLVFMFWKTIQQLEETVKLSRLQAVHRFRPWVGPVNSIELMSAANGRQQFSITMKNYGEIPASNVLAMFMMKNEMMTRDTLKNSKGADSFSLGPLLPNMEKRYWFFIDSDSIQKAKDGSAQIFISLYFAYEHPGGKSGYGMVSHFDTKINGFVHKDMWVD
ncbi:MAG: hypothetical protein ACRD9Q_09800 [Nitrososphaeraceae archaeon]